MLSINADIVCELIDLAREFHAQEQVVIPETPGNPSEDWAAQLLAHHIDDTTLQQFRTKVADLEPDQQWELVALLWLGREDYTLEEWDEAVALARDEWTPETGDYLIAHPLLADFWREGLELHGHSCE
jgi:hypothetical protein